MGLEFTMRKRLMGSEFTTRKKAMRKEFTTKISDGVRVHHEKEQWGESSP